MQQNESLADGQVPAAKVSAGQYTLTIANRLSASVGSVAALAIGESSVILLTLSLHPYCDTYCRSRGGCSRMTGSPTARRCTSCPPNPGQPMCSPSRPGASTPPHGLPSKKTGLITSDCGITRCLGIKWP